MEQVFANVSSDLRNVDTGVPPLHRLPVWSHQKLFKVPLDVADLQRLPEQSVSRVAEVVSNWRAGVLHGRKHRTIKRCQVNNLHPTGLYGHKTNASVLLSTLIIYRGTTQNTSIYSWTEDTCRVWLGVTSYVLFGTQELLECDLTGHSTEIFV